LTRRYRLITAVMIVILITATLTSSTNASTQSNSAEEAVRAAATLIKSSFPEIWEVVCNATPLVRPAQAGEYGEALSGFPSYVVKWSEDGVDVSVLVAIINSAATPVGIEVTVNGQASKESNELVRSSSNKVLTEVRALYGELTREAMSSGNVKIIGFQIHVNGIPVAFIEPAKPSIIPAMLSWNTYFVKPVLAFSIFDDYPIVKAAIEHAGKNVFSFNISVNDAKTILGKHKELGNVSRIDKYLLIANETARPAYVITLGPWNTAVVYADNGEFLSSITRTTRTAPPTSTSVPTPSVRGSSSWNLPIPPQYFPYFLSGLAMTVTAIIGIIVIRVATRKK